MTDRKLKSLPCWQGEITAEPLTGGLSNEAWVVRDDAGAHVVRFGRDYPFHHVSRERELMTARAAHAAGFAPAVEYAAPGVMVTEFLTARTWDEADMAAAPDRIADLLRDFHTAMPAGISGPAYLFWPFHVIRDYARTISAGNSRFVPRLRELMMLAVEMEAAQVPLPIIFGHNDMLPANVLEDDSRLWLIDFEYAGFSTAMFDLAGTASNSGMSDAAAHRLLTRYFGSPPTVQLWRAFIAMKCASLLREAMWAMVSDLHLNAPGADYAAYADENLTRLDAAVTAYRSLGKTTS